MDKILEINSFLVTVFGVGIISGLTKLHQYYKKTVEKREQREKKLDDRFLRLEKAQIAMLHNKIYRQCIRHLEDGYISIDDLDDLQYMFEAYVALGGNGTGEHLFIRVKNLPNRKEGS